MDNCKKDDCPICLEPLTKLNMTIIRYVCCGKQMHAKCERGMNSSKLTINQKLRCICCRAVATFSGSKEHTKHIENWANKGRGWAQSSLGDLYFKGEGVTRDYKTAIKWYKLAEQQGYVVAKRQLGLMYNTGKGCPQSYPKAIKYWKQSAKAGDAPSQYNLGAMYANGYGTDRSLKEARRWWTLSAKEGWKDSIQALQTLDTMEGETTTPLPPMSALDCKNQGNGHFKLKDYDEAIKWYTKAITMDPSHIYYSNRSASHLKKGNAAAALSDGCQCILIKPEWTKGYSRKGDALLMLKRYSEALATVRVGLQMDPNYEPLIDLLKRIQIEQTKDGSIDLYTLPDLDLTPPVDWKQKNSMNTGTALTMGFNAQFSMQELLVSQNLSSQDDFFKARRLLSTIVYHYETKSTNNFILISPNNSVTKNCIWLQMVATIAPKEIVTSSLRSKKQQKKQIDAADAMDVDSKFYNDEKVPIVPIRYLFCNSSELEKIRQLNAIGDVGLQQVTGGAGLMEFECASPEQEIILSFLQANTKLLTQKCIRKSTENIVSFSILTKTQLSFLSPMLKQVGQTKDAIEENAENCCLCGKKAKKGTKMKRCSRCKLATYCTAACQKTHWKQKIKGHKQLCQPPEGDYVDIDVGRLNATQLKNHKKGFVMHVINYQNSISQMKQQTKTVTTVKAMATRSTTKSLDKMFVIKAQLTQQGYEAVIYNRSKKVQTFSNGDNIIGGHNSFLRLGQAVQKSEYHGKAYFQAYMYDGNAKDASKKNKNKNKSKKHVLMRVLIGNSLKNPGW